MSAQNGQQPDQDQIRQAQAAQAAGFPVDPGNPFLMDTPASLYTNGQLPGLPPGKMLFTLRSVGVTVSLFLSKEDALAWAANLKTTADAMSGLLIAGAGQMPHAPIGPIGPPKG